MLSLIRDSVNVVFGNKDPKTSSVINANLYVDNNTSWWPKDKFPYFWFLVGSQENVWLLNRALGQESVAKMKPGSAIFLELATYKGDKYVFTKFKNDENRESSMRVPCENPVYVLDLGLACRAREFLDYIDKRLELASADANSCTKPYEVEASFMDTKLYTAQLLADNDLAEGDFVKQTYIAALAIAAAALF